VVAGEHQDSWHDDYLDTNLDVVPLEPDPQLEALSSWWVDGYSYHPVKGREASPQWEFYQP
jgi:hypothetical protein